MKFGETPLAEAQGAILAHSVKIGTRALKKGRTITGEDIAALEAAGRTSVIAARLDPGDVIENQAADRVAAALTCPGVSAAPAFTGRANFYAGSAGLCLIDREAVDRFNLIDESITIATIEPSTVVEPKQMVATVKIIPFAVRSEALDAAIAAIKRQGPVSGRAVQAASRGADPDHPARPQGQHPRQDASRSRATGSSNWAAPSIGKSAARIDPAALAPVIEAMVKAGARACCSSPAPRRSSTGAMSSRQRSRRWAARSSISACRSIPAICCCMARLGDVPVLGLPGCARSPKVNGFDWVLRACCSPVCRSAPTRSRRMGVGGLLAEIRLAAAATRRAGSAAAAIAAKPPQQAHIARASSSPPADPAHGRRRTSC